MIEIKSNQYLKQIEIVQNKRRLSCVDLMMPLHVISEKTQQQVAPRSITETGQNQELG